MSDPRTAFNLFGIECGIGWEPLYAPIIAKIQACGGTVLQVKEKFGGLRLYFGAPEPHNTEIDALVRAAEELSTKTCEICGKRGENRPQHGWWRTLCDEHEEERKNR